jgi:hypothetical protein
MGNASRTMLALGLAGMLFQPALAQPGRGPVGFTFSARYGLLQVKSVQEELKLTADQVKKITDLPQNVRDKHQKELQDLENKLVNEERQKKAEELHEMREKISQEIQKAQENILNDKQKKRFKEIQLQQLGAQAFHDRELQKALNLTGEQIHEINKINAELSEQMGQMRDRFRLPPFPPAPGQRRQVPDAQEQRKKSDALRKEGVDRVLAVLTEGQRKKYQEMIGAAFELKIERASIAGRRLAPALEKDKQNK